MSREADNMLTFALNALGVPPQARSGFGVTDFGEFYRIVAPEGRQIELDLWERVSSEGGMAAAIVRELRAMGFGLK